MNERDEIRQGDLKQVKRCLRNMREATANVEDVTAHFAAYTARECSLDWANVLKELEGAVERLTIARDLANNSYRQLVERPADVG